MHGDKEISSILTGIQFTVKPSAGATFDKSLVRVKKETRVLAGALERDLGYDLGRIIIINIPMEAMQSGFDVLFENTVQYNSHACWLV